MSTREILTLQFGNYSNYIGAHFWNLQELSFDYTGLVKTDINHDILYREGRTTTNDVTYTPRLLLADLKGSLKTLPESGGLLEENEDNSMPWEAIEEVKEPVSNKNQYLEDVGSEEMPIEDINKKEYNLEENVKTWTDYLYPRFHPRTVNVVKAYQHENESFDIFNKGKEVWNSEFGESFNNNIRKYIEECDSMQGFQINFDATDGFSGLALGCIESITDEYKKPIICHPVIASHFNSNNPTTQEERDISNLKDSFRLVNFALSLQELSEHVSFFIPLCTGEKGWRKPGNPRIYKYFNYNPDIYYHSSSILATAMDTLSQKYRHRNNIFTMSDICADMTGYGRRMAAASFQIPFTFNENEYLINYLNKTTQPIYTPITPSCKIATDKIFQLITVRGIPENYLKAPLKEAKDQMNIPAYRCNNVKEMFELYFQANNFLSATNVTICEKPVEVKTPFPMIFSEKLNQYGFVKNDDSYEKVQSCPVIAGYHNGNFLADMLEKLHREVTRIKFSKLNKFQDEGLEALEYTESLSKLAEFKDNYEDNFEL